MSRELYEEFLSSDDTLRVFRNGQLVFSSQKDRLIPLVEYLDSAAENGDVVMDRVTGNAAALLHIKGGASEVYSPLGSDIAVETLDKYCVKHHLGELVPRIMRDDGTDMCPMEKMSLGKTPEEFYQVMKDLIAGKK